MNRAPLILALWGLVTIYATSRVLQVFPRNVPMLAVVALHVFPPAIFALIHGAMFYGSRGILTFTALCLGIGVSAAGNILLVIPSAAVSVVSDPTGTQWRVSDITAACALTSIFIMGAFALLAWVRLADHKPEATEHFPKSTAVQEDSQCVV